MAYNHKWGHILWLRLRNRFLYGANDESQGAAYKRESMALLIKRGQTLLESSPGYCNTSFYILKKTLDKEEHVKPSRNKIKLVYFTLDLTLLPIYPQCSKLRVQLACTI